jgi:hypothetical protein
MLEITSIAANLMKIFAQRKYNSPRYDDTTAGIFRRSLTRARRAESPVRNWK